MKSAQYLFTTILYFSFSVLARPNNVPLITEIEEAGFEIEEPEHNENCEKDLQTDIPTELEITELLNLIFPGSALFTAKHEQLEKDFEFVEHGIYDDDYFVVGATHSSVKPIEYSLQSNPIKICQFRSLPGLFTSGAPLNSLGLLFGRFCDINNDKQDTKED